MPRSANPQTPSPQPIYLGSTLVGKQISHYRVIAHLGQGGMGVVYSAEDLLLRRTVALKLLSKALAGEQQYQRRFLREAQTASAINHPNICTIHDIIEQGEDTVIVMEYVDGITLRTWMQSQQKTIRGTPATDESLVLKIMDQLVDGLEAAHQKGVVHRDIKPENIMIDSRQRLKIMDFGLAKLKTDNNLTNAGSTLGTLRYMAPEQIRGGDADQRSDIYAAGIVLYEMFSGDIPWQADHNAALLYAKTNYPPERLADRVKGLSLELSRIVMKCIATEPGARYGSLGELRSDLVTYKNSSATQRVPLSLLLRLRESSVLTGIMHPTSWKSRSIAARWRLSLAFVGVIVLSVLGVTKLFPVGTARIAVLTMPEGASVEINGKHIGLSPLETSGVPAGPVRVSASLEGFTTRDTSLTLSARGSASLTLNLEQVLNPEGGPPSLATDSHAPPLKSISQLASFIIEDLRHNAHVEQQAVLLAPLSFQDSKASSAFARYFQKLLEARLARVPGWKVVLPPTNVDPGADDAARAFVEASGARYRLGGSYWRYKGVAQFFVTLEDLSSRTLVTTTEASVPAGALRLAGLSSQPGNLDRITQDERVIAKGEISSGPLKLDVWTSHGAENVLYDDGDTLAVFVRVNQPCYLRVIYNSADGKRWLMTGYDDVYIDQKNANQRVHLKEVGDLKEVLALTRGIKATSPKVSQVEKRIVITTIPRLLPGANGER